MMKLNLSCVILAGGESSRMGQDKTDIQVGSVRLFDYVYSKCHKLFSDIIIVTNKPLQFNGYQAHIVTDKIGGAGSLGGLYTGLQTARYDYSFCVACDMPFLQPEVIRYLSALRLNYDVVIPNIFTYLEPLHAVYAKQCIEPIKKFIKLGQIKLTKFLPEVFVRYVYEGEIKKIDPSLSTFINVNTQKDILKMQKMLQVNNGEKKIYEHKL
jgi:molybdopterin-guanine dinucleotide biosynthesis protein A